MEKESKYYVGTYTGPIKFGTGRILGGKGEGIYLLSLDLASGKIVQENVFPDVVNPSYLSLGRGGRYVYAVNELKEYQGKASGSVSAFSVKGGSGDLTFLNKQATHGTDPCHVAVNEAGTIYVANFMSGSVVVLPVNPDGSLEEAAQCIQHTGSSVDPARQQGPHAHATVISPDGRFVFIPDLGLDKLMIYQMDPDSGLLSEFGFFKTKSGAGPRHCTFSADGHTCYLINELDCTILVLQYDPSNGSFKELQCVSSLPEGLVVPGNSCADIHLTPDGKFLFGSNRGHNSLVIYQIDQASGLLEYIDCQPCGGAIPRNFAIDPSGEYLLCANQDSDNIVVFKIDQNSGKLEKISETEVPTPVCVIPAKV